MTDSKLVKEYVRSIKMDLIVQAPRFKVLTKNLPRPLTLKFRFVRDSKRKWDFLGPLETILDCISGLKYQKSDVPVKAIQWIADDDVHNVVPVLDPNWSVDPKNPGVEIEIIRFDDVNNDKNK